MMKRRTRRRITGTAAVLAAAAILYITHEPWAAAIAGIAAAILGLVRPTRRRQSLPRHRRPRLRAQRASQPGHLEFTLQCLYRLYDRTGRLLYVGICVTHPDRNVWDRIAEHEDTKKWWRQVNDRNIRVQYYPSRTAVSAAEAYAIHTEQPLYNRTHQRCIAGTCSTIRRARTRGYAIPPPPLPDVPRAGVMTR